MNRSGSAVRCLCESHGLHADAVLVVFDDVHLPLGKLRMRAGGSAAGHRGLESVIESLQTEAVPRLRLGVGAPPAGIGASITAGMSTGMTDSRLAEYVLADFLAEEEPIVTEMVERAARAVTAWLESGIGIAMNLANAPDLPADAAGTNRMINPAGGSQNPPVTRVYRVAVPPCSAPGAGPQRP